jgi:hypothetical protein
MSMLELGNSYWGREEIHGRRLAVYEGDLV